MFHLNFECTPQPKVTYPYLELVQVGGGLPVLVVTDARHAWKAD